MKENVLMIENIPRCRERVKFEKSKHKSLKKKETNLDALAKRKARVSETHLERLNYAVENEKLKY